MVRIQNVVELFTDDYARNSQRNTPSPGCAGVLPSSARDAACSGDSRKRLTNTESGGIMAKGNNARKKETKKPKKDKSAKK